MDLPLITIRLCQTKEISLFVDQVRISLTLYVVLDDSLKRHEIGDARNGWEGPMTTWWLTLSVEAETSPEALLRTGSSITVSELLCVSKTEDIRAKHQNSALRVAKEVLGERLRP